MITKEQNDLLTRVEGDAPMGKLMRHYWIPAFLSSQITPDGDPLRVRLLGKDYVAFRATDGRIAMFDERCPHRGVSLVLARNANCALQCIFHGWKIDVTGKVVDVPTQADNPEAFAATVKVNKYPLHEGGGIIWAWLGEGEAPVFPELAFNSLPDSQVWMTITKAHCNWLQGVDATLDSAHIGTLHESYMKIEQAKGSQANGYSLAALAPRYYVRNKPYGFAAEAHRHLADGSTYVRTTQYLMPFISFLPGGEHAPGILFIVTPIDDHNHNLIWGMCSPGVDIPMDGDVPVALRDMLGTLPFDKHDFGRFTGDRDHNFGQDREAMRNGHFSGFTGNLIQEDMVTQASMGTIVDRTLDHLSSADLAVIRTQKLLLDALQTLAEGGTPPGAGDNLDYRDVLPEHYVIAAGADRDGAHDFYQASVAAE